MNGGNAEQATPCNECAEGKLSRTGLREDHSNYCSGAKFYSDLSASPAAPLLWNMHTDTLYCAKHAIKIIPPEVQLLCQMSFLTRTSCSVFKKTSRWKWCCPWGVHILNWQRQWHALYTLRDRQPLIVLPCETLHCCTDLWRALSTYIRSMTLFLWLSSSHSNNTKQSPVLRSLVHM